MFASALHMKSGNTLILTKFLEYIINMYITKYIMLDI
jgi:hypothetical protein